MTVPVTTAPRSLKNTPTLIQTRYGSSLTLTVQITEWLPLGTSGSLMRAGAILGSWMLTTYGCRTSWKSKLLYWSEILRRLLRMVEHLSGTPGPPQRTKPTSFTRWAWRRTQLMNHPHYSSFFLI